MTQALLSVLSLAAVVSRSLSWVTDKHCLITQSLFLWKLPVLGTLSGDLVTGVWVHWRDFRLIKTVNKSTGKQWFKHCSGICHIWYKSSTEAVTWSYGSAWQWPRTVTRTPPRPVTALSAVLESLDSSRDKQCSSAACQCLSLLSTSPVLWPQCCGPMPAVHEHCPANGIKFTNAIFMNRRRPKDSYTPDNYYSNNFRIFIFPLNIMNLDIQHQICFRFNCILWIDEDQKIVMPLMTII